MTTTADVLIVWDEPIEGVPSYRVYGPAPRDEIASWYDRLVAQSARPLNCARAPLRGILEAAKELPGSPVDVIGLFVSEIATAARAALTEYEPGTPEYRLAAAALAAAEEYEKGKR